MSLGVLGYAGQAAIGMDESARRRRAREEEEMKLAQQRRAESEAQRKAALEAFARQQQVGLMKSMDLGATPEMRAGATPTVAQTPPKAGLAPPAAAAPSAAAPAAPTGPTREAQLAGLQNQLRQLRSSGGQSTSATPAYMKQEAELLKQIKALETQAAPPQAAPPQSGLLTPQQAQAAYATAEGKDKRFLGLIATGSESAVPEGTRKRLAQQYGGAATAPVSAQAVATALGTSPDAPVVQATVQAAESIGQTTQQVAQETSPVMYGGQDPSFVQQIPQAVQQGMSTREKLASMYTEAANAGYPELAAQYYQQISDIDATLIGMYQTQALANLERMGDPAALAGELERSLGVPVTIARKGDKFQVSFGGKERDYTLEQLREDAKLQFDADYKAALMKAQSERSMELFKTRLGISLEQAKAIFAGQVETMKPVKIKTADGGEVLITNVNGEPVVFSYGEQERIDFSGKKTTISAPLVQMLPSAIM